MCALRCTVSPILSPPPTSMQHTTSHTTAVQSPSHLPHSENLVKIGPEDPEITG